MLFVSNYVIFLIIELAKSNFYYLKVLLSGESFYSHIHEVVERAFLEGG